VQRTLTGYGQKHASAPCAPVVHTDRPYRQIVSTTALDSLNGAKTLIEASAFASPGDPFSLTYQHSS
jgi:hypothetical protein